MAGMKAKSHVGHMAVKGSSNSAFKKSNASNNPHRPDKDKGKGFFRSRGTINRLNMYNDKPDMEKRREQNTDPKAGRIEPDRRWYGNTRQLDQKELHKYMSVLEN